MSGDFRETGSLTPRLALSPNANRTWLKRTTANPPMTPAAKQIATRCVRVKRLSITFKACVVMTKAPFHYQRPRDGVQPTLGERCQRRRNAFHGLVHERRREVHDVSAALREHLPDGPLRDVEEPGQVHRQHFGEVGLGVLGEWFGNENPGVV